MKLRTIFAAACILFSSAIFAQNTLPVSGVTGNLLKRIISFGDFTTSKVKAVSVNTSVNLAGAEIGWSKMKYSFTQTSPSGEAEVKAFGNPKNDEIAQFRNLLGIDSNLKAVFSGTITTSAAVWAFYIDGGAKVSDAPCGKLIKGEDITITITGGDFTSMGDMMMNKLEFTYNFLLNGEVIGKVTTDNNKEVWFKEGLDEETSLALASAYSALLTRIGMSAN